MRRGAEREQRLRMVHSGSSRRRRKRYQVVRRNPAQLRQCWARLQWYVHGECEAFLREGFTETILRECSESVTNMPRDEHENNATSTAGRSSQGRPTPPEFYGHRALRRAVDAERLHRRTSSEVLSRGGRCRCESSREAGLGSTVRQTFLRKRQPIGAAGASGTSSEVRQVTARHGVALRSGTKERPHRHRG